MTRDGWEFDASHLMMAAANGSLDQVRPLVQAGALADAAREITGWHNRVNGEIQDASVRRIVEWLHAEAKRLRESRQYVGFEARPMDSPARRAAMVGVRLKPEERTLDGYSDDAEPQRVQRRFVTEWTDQPVVWIHEADDWEIEQVRRHAPAVGSPETNAN